MYSSGDYTSQFQNKCCKKNVNSYNQNSKFSPMYAKGQSVCTYKKQSPVCLISLTNNLDRLGRATTSAPTASSAEDT